MQAPEGISNSRSGVCRGAHTLRLFKGSLQSICPLFTWLNLVHVSLCKIEGGCAKLSAKIQKQKEKGQEVILELPNLSWETEFELWNESHQPGLTMSACRVSYNHVDLGR